MSQTCHIVGIHEHGAAGLTAEACGVLREARLVIGATHQLAAVAGLLSPAAEPRDSAGQLAAVPEWIVAATAAGHRVAVLATGDPLCHGIAGRLTRQLAARAPDLRLVVLPSVSSLQLACARFHLPWQDAALVSLHTADTGEWAPGARHDHGLAPLLRAVARHDKVLCLTAPANGPARIARALVAAGLGAAFRVDVAARLTAPDELLVADLAPAEAARRDFPDPNVVILRRVLPRQARPAFGFADGAYVQRQPEKGLLTKLEARAVSLAKLGLTPAAIVWDIGAGAGTIGLEAAGLCPDGHVYAIEKNVADAANARENARRFGVLNYTLVEGKAPQHLAGWPDPAAVFIGGSGGELGLLITLCLQRLRPGGHLVMNFVTLENLATATAALSAAGVPWEVTQLFAARSQPILDMHRLAAQNPVWIVSAVRAAAPPARSPDHGSAPVARERDAAAPAAFLENPA